MEEIKQQDAEAVAGGETTFKHIYTVQPGDTLMQIAQLFNTDIHLLYKENEGILGSPFPGKLRPGMKLEFKRYGNFGKGEAGTGREYL